VRVTYSDQPHELALLRDMETTERNLAAVGMTATA